MFKKLITLLILLLSLSSCKTTKKINRERVKEVKTVDRVLDKQIYYTYDGSIKTTTIKEPVFIDSAGTQVRAVKTIIFEERNETKDSLVNKTSTEASTINTRTVSVDKDIKRTNYTGLIIFIVLLTVLILYLRRLFR